LFLPIFTSPDRGKSGDKEYHADITFFQPVDPEVEEGKKIDKPNECFVTILEKL